MVDRLSVTLSGDAWNGNPLFTLDLDGVQLAGPTEVSARHAIGNLNTFVFTGDWGSNGPHTVAVHFLNDAYGGSTSADRNLYVRGISFDGDSYSAQSAQNDARGGGADVDPNAAEMYFNGTVTIEVPFVPDMHRIGTEGSDFLSGLRGNDTFEGLEGDDSLHGGYGNDTLIGGAGNDFLNGEAGDDVLIGGDGNDRLDNSAGLDTMTGGAGRDTFRDVNFQDALTLGGSPTITDFEVGPGGDEFDIYGYNLVDNTFVMDTVYKRMTDLPGGGTRFDIGSIPTSINPHTITFENVSRDDFSRDNFLVLEPPFPKGDPTQPRRGDHYTETLTVHVSEDAWNGDAVFRVVFDGKELTGAVKTTTAHASGISEDLVFGGNFGAGLHTVEVKFVNDAYGGSLDTDRNLYVHGITFNGLNYAGQTAENTSSGGADTDPAAAELYSNGSVIFRQIGASPGTSDTFIATRGMGDLTVSSFDTGSQPGHDVLVLDGFYDVSVAAMRANAVVLSSSSFQLILGQSDSVILPGHLSDYTDDNFVIRNAVAEVPGHHLIGTASNDTLNGSVDDDTIEGGDGSDRIAGSYGDDTLLGGNGDDYIAGGTRTDALPSAEDGHDIIDSGPGRDILWGGPQTTFVVRAGNGSDEIVDPWPATGDMTKSTIVLDGYALASMADVHAHATRTDGGFPTTTIDLGNGETLTLFDHLQEHLVPSVDWFNFVFRNVSTPPSGSGLVLHVSEDAWNGDAQFSVLMDGTQIGGVRTTTASHALGQVQDIAVDGTFSSGAHNVEIRFLNDGWGGTADTDRNLYVEGITFNGVNYAGQSAINTAQNGQPDADPGAAEMYTNGSVVFNNVGGSGPPPPPSGNTSTIVLHVSEDAFQGDAQFNVRVDGAAQIATFTAHASHAAGQSENITITGDFGTQGPGTIDIQFLNDAWGGSADADRNLYVQSIDVNGVHFQGNTATNNAANGAEATDPTAAVMDINGTATFHIDHTAPPQIMG